VPPRTTNIAELNAYNREYWRQRKLRCDQLIAIPGIARLALVQANKLARSVSLATSESERIATIRGSDSFETDLELYYDAVGSTLQAEFNRRQKLKEPRGKLLDNKSLAELVIEVFSDPERSKLNGKEAWKALPGLMAKFGIILIEIDPAVPSKDKYGYEFRDRQKTLSRGHFQNLLSKARRNISD
jgi:hypothetical protein